jgi:hypothetical protein
MHNKNIYNKNWKIPAAWQQFSVRRSTSVTARPRNIVSWALKVFWDVMLGVMYTFLDVSKCHSAFTFSNAAVRTSNLASHMTNLRYAAWKEMVSTGPIHYTQHGQSDWTLRCFFQSLHAAAGKVDEWNGILASSNILRNVTQNHHPIRGYLMHGAQNVFLHDRKNHSMQRSAISCEMKKTKTYTVNQEITHIGRLKFITSTQQNSTLRPFRGICFVSQR